MPKPKKHSDDKLLMAVRKVLQSVEPRPLPTETMVNEVIINGSVWARHEGWKCPICGEYCRRQDRTVRRRYGSERIIDYSGYNMHFAHSHGEEFWKEKQVIKVVRAHLRSQT